MATHADLRALFVNTSLKKKAGDSHTRLLLDASAGIMEKNGVAVEHLHLADHAVPPGIYPDMTEHGWDEDEWPALWEKFKSAEILVVGTPLWLGEESSICRILIERLYAMSGELNHKGQSIYYGKVGGCAGCTVLVQTDEGPAMTRVCGDGPVFDAASGYPAALSA
jgi:multimeric flavodoxin WrbA